MTTPITARDGLAVERWPSELPLFTICAGLSALTWALLIASVVGLVVVLLIAPFVLLAHAVSVAHVRGNGVRVAPDQFQELYAAVVRISRQLGLERTPETYVIQQGGFLQTLATQFLGSTLLVLSADLLDACDTPGSRDMLVGREIGHICAGHLRWDWFILPTRFVPFLGTGLARARELTSDRYGLLAAGSLEHALGGLSILAAGGTRGPLLNRKALARQQRDLTGFWMTIGEWLSSHPPLTRRLAALDAGL